MFPYSGHFSGAAPDLTRAGRKGYMCSDVGSCTNVVISRTASAGTSEGFAGMTWIARSGEFVVGSFDAGVDAMGKEGESNAMVSLGGVSGVDMVG